MRGRVLFVGLATADQVTFDLTEGFRDVRMRWNVLVTPPLRVEDATGLSIIWLRRDRILDVRRAKLSPEKWIRLEPLPPGATTSFGRAVKGRSR